MVFDYSFSTSPVEVAFESIFRNVFSAGLAPTSFTKPVNRELGEIVVSEIGQDFLDRAIGSAICPIMDACLAAFFCFSLFFPGRARRKTAWSRWRRCSAFCSLPPARKPPPIGRRPFM